MARTSVIRYDHVVCGRESTVDVGKRRALPVRTKTQMHTAAATREPRATLRERLKRTFFVLHVCLAFAIFFCCIFFCITT